MAAAIEPTNSIRKAAFPSDLTKLRSFLGACNVYRRFVQAYAKIARPLTEILRKDKYQDWYNPTEEQVAAFEKLKNCLAKQPVLSFPMANRPLKKYTDASAYSLGAVLLQKQDLEDSKKWATIGYWSKALAPAEKNYSIQDG